MKQGDQPDWAPLLKAVGEEVTGDFMWMFEVECTDATPLHAYKHIDTRRLGPPGRGLVRLLLEPPNRYRATPLADQLMAVFWRMGELAG